jgi:hypothetical protein
MSSTLVAGNTLHVNQYIQSPSGNFFFGIFPAVTAITPMVTTTPTANTGILGVFAGTPSKPLGVSYIIASGVSAVTMQGDGNLCATNGSSVVWCAMTQGEPNFVVMQDDANLCVYVGADPSKQGAFKWGSRQQGGKTSGFGAMPTPPIRMDLVVNTSVGGCSYSIQWNGGETDRLDINGSFSVASYQGPAGLNCWLRGHNSGGNHDSGDNFNFGEPHVVYNLSLDGLFRMSWSRQS